MLDIKGIQPKRPKTLWMVFCAFLIVIVGGAFYWRYLDARDKAHRSAAEALFQVRKALSTDQRGCHNLRDKFEQLIESSTGKQNNQRKKRGKVKCKNTK